MIYKKILAAIALAGMMAACQSSESISVADYCADPERAAEHVCQLNVELNGTRTALADTDLKLSEARAMANSALSAASRAQTTADSALATANEARSLALSSVDNLVCQTNTINQTDTGSCPVNYRLMSCTQTRYTHRAGGLSFLREINDETCRFNSRVLEMKVRCCTVAANRSVSAQTVANSGAAFTPVPRPIAGSQPTSATAKRVYNRTIGKDL